MKIAAIRATALCLSFSVAVAPVQAGFLDDFYNQSGATVNITPAGIYQGQSSNVIAGGALTMRVPNRTFNPLTFSPPNFSAGCGGIDMYLGAFGFPTGAEMTAYLRNVGQAAGGIAFSIALKALSPELDATINDFSKRIQEMVGDFKNSCKMASTLMEASGASGFIQELATNARKQLRLSSSDETKAETTSADPKAAKDKAIQFAKSNPNSGLNPERNIVWEALNSGEYGTSLSNAEKRFIMSITGSLISRIDNYTDSSLPRLIPLPPAQTSVDKLITTLIGTTGVQNVSTQIYSCTNKATDAPANYSTMASNNCLIATLGTEEIGGGFRYRLEESKNAVVSAIRNRSAIDTTIANHYAVLHGASAMPLLKVVQAAAAKRNSFVGETTLTQYLDIASAEMAIRYLRFAVSEVRRTVGHSDQSNSQASADEMTKISARADEITRELDAREKSLIGQISNLASTLQMYESTQRYMQASMSTDLTRSMNFGR